VKVAGQRLRPAAVAYVLIEDVLILGSLVAAIVFASSWRLEPFRSPGRWVHLAIFFLCVKATFFYASLYDLRRMTDRRTFWKRLLVALLVTVGAGWVVGVWLLEEPVAWVAFPLAFGPTVVLGRLLFETLTRRAGYRKRLLFLGIGEHARRTARELIDGENRDYEVVGFLAETEEGRGWRIGQKPVLGLYGDLERIVAEQRIDKVVVAMEDRRKQLPLESLLEVRIRGVEVLEEARVHEEIAGKIPVEDLRPSWLIFSEGFTNTPLRNVTKRAFDITVSLLGLILAAPIAAAVAVAIKLESRGPLFYRQKRVGLGGREFTVYKFRSMRQDAEAPGKPQWAQKDDPRVTRVGRFIRKVRLDEIPQMWNVLQGTMSFVGPRPERAHFVEKLRETIPFYDQRHAVKPGLTGWAQVRFRYGADETDAIEKLRHDMFYIKHHSLLFDMRILLETVKVVLDKAKAH
jgi:sugar transferase (PEP-CTERM system associated)